MEWMLMPYKRYFDFSGRSRRKEYWMFTLFQIIVALILIVPMIAGIPGTDPDTGVSGEPGILFWVSIALLSIFVLASIIPSIAVSVRRFHDQDKSGWFYLISFVPYVGGLIVFVFMLLEGTRGPNQYGEDPKNPNSASVFS